MCMLDYGIVGNCKSCALVSKEGSIDWFCFPEFDSPSVFAKILDEEKGGHFCLVPEQEHKASQRYLPNTNILETLFESDKSSFKVIDFFPRYNKLVPGGRKKPFRQNKLIRLVFPIKGKPSVRVFYKPKLMYAAGGDLDEITGNRIITRNHGSEIHLTSNLNPETITNNDAFILDKPKCFIIGDKVEDSKRILSDCKKLLFWTKKYWEGWVSSLALPEKYKGVIIRSALTLKLLTFSESGAILAAATTSIPEEIGTERTFDYRFCWIRDASFTVDALKKIGRDHEARKLLNFIIDNTLKKKKKLQIMYGIRGETDLEEKTLDHLSGFMDSRPVRIGNAAHGQKQNDIYGSVIDILYLYFVYYEYEKKMRRRHWKLLKYLVKEIRKNWMGKDSGIWEFRGTDDHFTYSKLMCFLGMDRATRIAEHYNKNSVALRWARLREKIREDILQKAWNPKKNAFTMTYGGKEMDASLLTMSYHDFLEPEDPRLVGTVHMIGEELGKGPFLQRYMIEDDFGRSKSSFTICSFWMAYALYFIGEKQKAQDMFDELMKYSNHLGLFSEDLDVENKDLLGNFPQAYTHIAVINTAVLLSEWASKRKKLEPRFGKKNWL